MGKSKRATRKQLEEVVQELTGELYTLKQNFGILGGYIGAYVEFNGHALEFTNFLKNKSEETEKTNSPKTGEKGIKSDKQSRYKKISSPL